MLQRVEERAPAKVNLCLHVLGRRTDGYHELDSVVAFAGIADRLIITRAPENRLTVSGPFAAGVPLGEANIIWKTWNFLKGLSDIPEVSVELEKNLPVASGLGGGSADAAAMLRGLARLHEIDLNDDVIASLAKALGADVPVCYYGKACQMQGIGETIRTLSIKLPPAIVLVNPGLACETASVFRAMGLAPGQPLKDAVTLETPAMWRNDLTAAAITVQPVIANVLQALSQSGLETVRMSGSGASCFGLADSLVQAEEAAARLGAQHRDWWVKAARLL